MKERKELQGDPNKNECFAMKHWILNPLKEYNDPFLLFKLNYFFWRKKLQKKKVHLKNTLCWP